MRVKRSGSAELPVSHGQHPKAQSNFDDRLDAICADLADGRAQRDDLHKAIEDHEAALSVLTEVVRSVAARCDQLVDHTLDARRATVRHGEEALSILFSMRAAQVGLEASTTPTAKELQYRQTVQRIREIVRAQVPADATVIVASKGDDDLTRLYGREAWHFPRTADGRYAGYHPHSGMAAVVHLTALRANGGDYFLLPATSRWWLDHYPDLRRHLELYCRLVADENDVCLLYDLRGEPDSQKINPTDEVALAIDLFKEQFGSDPSVLVWGAAKGLKNCLLERRVLTVSRDEDRLPYLDKTIDIVVIETGDEAQCSEAGRVARVAVVSLDESDQTPTQVYGPSIRTSTRWTGHDQPRQTTSILIPCFNGLKHTQACLNSLDETLPDSFEGEIVVIDDGSSDGTWKWLGERAQQDDRLVPVRNNHNLGFLETINRGAEIASGEILVLLNNDTITLPGWLPPLLRIFNQRPDAGVVGGKLLFADGRLQEAGAVVFCDGTAAKVGYFDVDLESPLYNYVRPVDYCSGALLATPRRLFEELGGFDKRYNPAYYEDTDYCFRIREFGRRVYYQPESVIIHVEGATAGTDVTTGVKRHQVANHAVFVARWADVLCDYPQRPPEPFDHSTLHRLVTRPDAMAVA